MNHFSVSGLSSGIDFAKLIEQLVSIKRQRALVPLESEKSSYKSKLAEYNTLGSKVQNMETAADILRKSSSFDVNKAAVEDDTIFTASASSSALAGNYVISDITALAQAHKVTNVDAKSVADKDTTTVLANGNTFQFTVGGAQTTITATSDLTLEELVIEINISGGAAQATIINDGNATIPYRIVLTSDTTGSTGGITIDQDQSILDLDNSSGSGGTFELQAAQNAAFKMDGLDVSKSSNNISDVIEGVTFTLKNAPGVGKSYTLTVTNDTDAIKSNIKTLVDSYNAIVSQIANNSKFDFEKSTGGPLYNESVTRAIQRRLSSIITSGISGLSESTKALSQVGVKTNKDGTLTLDEGVLSSKLTSDFGDVRALFIDDSATAIEGVAKKLYDVLNDITNIVDGAVTIRTRGIQRIIDRNSTEIIDVERELIAYEQSLKTRFAGLEALLNTMNIQGNYLQSIF